MYFQWQWWRFKVYKWDNWSFSTFSTEAKFHVWVFDYEIQWLKKPKGVS